MEAWTRTAVHADKVTSSDDLLVGAVHPRSPRINVANLRLYAHGADHTPDIVDLLSQRAGVGVATVQILRADGDGDDPVAAVRVNDRLQRGLLLSVMRAILGPDADENLAASRNGSRDSVLEGVAVGCSVQAHRGDVLREALQLVERALPLVLGLAGAIFVIRGDV